MGVTMRSLLSSILLLGFLNQTNFTYVSAAEESSVPTGINIQTNFCTSTWINGATGNDIRNEFNVVNRNTFEVRRPCNSVTRNTPLHLALIGGAGLDKIEAFIDSGADVLARNAADDDAVLLARRYSSSNVYSYIWNVVTETEEFQTVVLQAAVNSLAEEQFNYVTPESDDAEQGDNNKTDTQTEGGFYNFMLVSRVANDLFREAYDDYIWQLRQDLHRYYTDSRYTEIDVEYYQDILKRWDQLLARQNNYTTDIEEYYQAYQDPWHRNAPIGIYVSVAPTVVLKSLITQEHSTSSGDNWSSNIETQVGLALGIRAGWAWPLLDSLPLRVRLEAGFTRSQIAGNRDYLSERGESFSNLNINTYEANAILDLPKLFENAGRGWRNISLHVGGGIINVDPNLAYTVSLDNAANNSNTFHLEGDNSPGVQGIVGMNYALTSRIQLGFEARFKEFRQDFTSSNHRWEYLREKMSQTYNARIGKMSGTSVALTGTLHLNKIGPWK